MGQVWNCKKKKQFLKCLLLWDIGQKSFGGLFCETPFIYTIICTIIYCTLIYHLNPSIIKMLRKVKNFFFPITAENWKPSCWCFRISQLGDIFNNQVMQTIEIFNVLVATIYKSADGRKKVTIVMVDDNEKWNSWSCDCTATVSLSICII